MESRQLLSHHALNKTLDRLAYQVFEQHIKPNDLAIIALQPRGVYLGRRILERLKGLVIRIWEGALLRLAFRLLAAAGGARAAAGGGAGDVADGGAQRSGSAANVTIELIKDQGAGGDGGSGVVVVVVVATEGAGGVV